MTRNAEHAALQTAAETAKTAAARRTAKLALLDYEAGCLGDASAAKLAADLRASAKAHRAAMRALRAEEKAAAEKAAELSRLLAACRALCPR